MASVGVSADAPPRCHVSVIITTFLEIGGKNPMRGKMLKDRAVAYGRPIGSSTTDIVGKTGQTPNGKGAERYMCRFVTTSSGVLSF